MNKQALFSISVVFLFMITFVSCSTDRNYPKKIIGSWIVDSMRLIAPGMPDSLSHKDEGKAKGQKWNFKNDGTFAVNLNTAAPNKGQYSISNIDTNYFLYLDNGTVDIKNKARIVMQIQNITEKTLILSVDNGAATFIFYLSKQ